MDYRHIGYFNGADAIKLMNSTPDEIANKIGKKKEGYQKSGEAYTEDEEYFTLNYDGQYTKDKKYIIVYDVANHWDGEDLSQFNKRELMDEFIDIYKKVS